MDTKRRKGEADKRAAALQAKTIIEEWRPDVVITADDNAARYLIKPHYRDRDTPLSVNPATMTDDATDMSTDPAVLQAAI